jgi:hypothetical protein
MGHSFMDIVYGKDHHKRYITKQLVKERKALIETLNNEVEASSSDTICTLLESLLETNKQLILNYDKDILNEGKESTRSHK